MLTASGRTMSSCILATVAGADGTLQRVSLTQSDSDQGFGDAAIDALGRSEAEAMRASECGVRLATDGALHAVAGAAESAHADLYLFGAGHVGKASSLASPGCRSR